MKELNEMMWLNWSGNQHLCKNINAIVGLKEKQNNEKVFTKNRMVVFIMG